MSLRFAILGILAEENMSGYDLFKRFEHSLAAVWPARQNNVYTELGRLCDQGSVRIASEGARGKKIYALQEQGLAELRGWLRDTEFSHTLRSETLLRTNFLWVLDPPEVHRFLESELAYHRNLESWLKEQTATLPESKARRKRTLTSIDSRRMAADAGLKYLAAMIDWLQDALRLSGQHGRK